MRMALNPAIAVLLPAAGSGASTPYPMGADEMRGLILGAA